MPDTDLISIVWAGLMSQLDTDAEPTALADACVKQIKVDATILEAFAKSARTEVALMCARGDLSEKRPFAHIMRTATPSKCGRMKTRRP